VNTLGTPLACLLLTGVAAMLVSIGTPTGLVFSAIAVLSGTWWLAQSADRKKRHSPETLAEQIAEISVKSLDKHFPVAEYPQELRPVAGQLNRLLDRVGTAFETERRFSGNVAHELATPVAELRALAEVALRSPTGTETALAQDALEIAREMQSTVEFLLALSRCEPSLQPSCTKTTNVTGLVEELSTKLAPKAQARNLHWGFSAATRVSAETNPAMLRSVIANLLENALEYTPPSGKVSGRLEQTPCGFAFTLTNTTHNLVAGDLQHLFEPLWRKDRARTERVHAGLGLTLVKSLADVLGLEIRAEITHPSVLQMTLRQSERNGLSLGRNSPKSLHYYNSAGDSGVMQSDAEQDFTGASSNTNYQYDLP
jgi:signal transduction histidine kinase